MSDDPSHDRRNALRAYFEHFDLEDLDDLETLTTHAFDFFIVISLILRQRDPDRYARWELRQKLDVVDDLARPRPRRPSVS